VSSEVRASDGKTPGNGRSRGGKYLTFFLGEEEYGIEILRVNEIIGMLPITPIPQTDPWVRGVINLRGKVIPVLDLRLKLGMEAAEETEETCIIVVQIQGALIGVIVDKVSEVLDIDEAQVEDPPALGMGVETDLLLGIGKAEGKVKLLLDIDRVLTPAELELMDDAVTDEQGVLA